MTSVLSAAICYARHLLVRSDRAQGVMRKGEGQRRGFSPLALIAWAMAPAALGAQGVSATKPVRTLIGDVALILRSDRPGTLRIGVAGSNRSLSLSVRSTDARRWADSAAKLVVPAPRRRAKRGAPSPADTSVRRRAVLEEPGVGAGTFVLLRIDSAATRRFLLFVDDATLEGIRQPLEPEEATLLIRLIRSASAPPRAGSAKKGATSGKKGATSGKKGATSAKQGATSPPGHPSTEMSSLSPPPSSAGTPVHGR